MPLEVNIFVIANGETFQHGPITSEEGAEQGEKLRIAMEADTETALAVLPWCVIRGDRINAWLVLPA